jgi:cellulose synthase/poly-beta-1,6-N-acetylglucosamine synthase-like glycosyltransferase
MSVVVNAVIVGFAAILGIAPLLLTARFKRQLALLEAREKTSSHHPPAALILPCKGLDPGFGENMRSFVEQDYPDLEFLFVVATTDDPAHDALKEMLQALRAEKPALRATLLVAGIGQNRAQKLNNQLAALREVSDRAEVLVFVDSDTRPDRGFIRRLLAPLHERGTGATTGYRWYQPPRPTLGSLLRSTWNAGALPFLVDPMRNFAWGGAMAISRANFVQARIGEAWQKAVSDDMTFTVAVRKLGLGVRFVPECIAVSYEPSTLAETVEFTNRQSVISRVYFPPLWWSTAIGHATASVLVVYGAVSLCAWLHGGNAGFLLGSACLLLLPLQMGNAAWLFGSVRALLPQLARELEALRWHYILMAPLASFLTLVNTLHAATTRRITWRGVRYELRSPAETIVLSSED